jgi:hypothetical protein
MIDRALAIVGLAIGIIFGAWSLAPDSWAKIPSWLSLGGIIAGVLLFGIGVGMFLSAQVPEPSSLQEPIIIETGLFLQFTDNSSIPIAKYIKNIKFWYALYTESITVNTKDKDGNNLGGFAVPARWTVFIIFDKPPVIKQLLASCIGPNRPSCIVQTANSAYAIITVAGDVTNATLDISAAQ